MADITFIDKDPEQILVDTIALFQEKSGTTLNDADPERILIDCMVYREVLLRNGMEWLMRQNFVQLSEGTALDYWGELFGIARTADEIDNSYRIRILANKSLGLGTKAAYRAKILSLSNVADVLLFTKNDEPELLPGHVRLIPIRKVTDPVTLVASGSVHDAALESEILAAIVTDEFGVVGSTFQFSQAVPVAIGGTINIRSVVGYDPVQLASNIDYQLSRYFGQLSLSFAAEFGLTGISNYLLNAEGLQQIVNLNFDNVPVLATGQFYQRGLINVNIE